MTVIAVAAAKSSPGVSTVAELLAQLGPPGPGRVLLDCDPAGGDWLLRPGVRPEPGLASLAMAGRRGLAPGEVLNHVQRLGEDLAVLVAPAAGRQATSALEMVGEALVDHLRTLKDLAVVVDCGALSPASPALPLAAGADLVVMVSRATARAMVHLAPWVEQLAADAVPVAVVLVRHGPAAKAEAAYRPAEVADALGVEVLGPLADDPDGAARLYAEPGRLAGLARSALVRSMTSVAEAIFARATHGPIPPAGCTSLAPTPAAAR
jgi:MinD-like ATPase involved in chromosome partitioning or flagellar assembly